MLEFLTQFLELQLADAQRLAIQKQLDAYPAMLKAQDDRVNAAQQALAALENESRAAQLEQRKLEKQTAEFDEKIKRYENQEGQVTSEKQLHAIEHEIAAIRANVSPLEDRILEILTRADDLAGLIPQAKAQLEKARTEAAAERARIEEQIKAKREALALIDRDRERFRARLDPAYLKDYDILSHKYPGKVAVPLQGEASCGGCFTQLLPGLVVLLRKGGEAVRCQQCGRFLYPPEKNAANAKH